MLLQFLACRLDLHSFEEPSASNGHPPAGSSPTVTLHESFGQPAPKTVEDALNVLRPHVAYVPPDDVVFGFDTPREAIVFRHQLAYGSSKAQAEGVAATLLAELGLEQCADNMIAPGVGLRGISGGQRRRTCIAMALVTRPAILVLDEPTTGLDSNTAKQVMAAVQVISRRYNCAVVQSLQQPGSDLFPHFDDLIMLNADGSLEYAGPTENGPASVPKAHHQLKAAAPTAADNSASDPTTDATTAVVVADANESPDNKDAASSEAPLVVGSASLPTVTALVISRHFRALLRNPLALLMRVAQAVVLAVFFGVVFWDMALTADNFKQVLGFLMVFVSASFIPVQTGAAVFPMEKDVFLEEQKLPYRYPAWIYGLSKLITEGSAQLPLSVVYAGVMGGMVGFPGPNVGKLILTALLQGAASESFGFFISTIADPAIAIGVITPVVAFIMLIVGTSLASGQGSTEEIFDVLKHLAFLRNGYSALALDVLPLVDVPCSNPGFCFFNNADEALRFYDLDGSSTGREWGLLVMWAVLFRIAAAVALTAMGWKQRIVFDAAAHNRAAAVVAAGAAQSVEEAEKTDTAASHHREPCEPPVAVDCGATGLSVELAWQVRFRVRPTFGEGSDNKRTILQPMRGVAHAGRTLAIMGGSGAGKSTLLEALSLRLPPSNVFTETERDTRIDLRTTATKSGDGSSAAATVLRNVGAEARALIAFVHQDPAFVPGLTAREVVAFAVVTSSDATADQQRARVDELLAQLGLAHAADAVATCLSGSQRKRLAVAAALAQDRPVLMLDEPTSGLDPASALRLLTLLRDLARERNRTVMYTLHQPGDELLPHIDDLLLLSAGHVVYHGPLDEADVAFAGFTRAPGANATDHYLELSADPDAVATLVARWKATTAAAKSNEDDNDDATNSASDATALDALTEPFAGLRVPGAGFAALVRRCFTVTVLRVNRLSLALRFFSLFVLMPLVIGVAMYDQASNVVSLQNAAFVFVLSLSFASAMTPLMDLHLERLTFLRDQEACSYSPVAYYLAFTVSSLPLDTIGLLVGAGLVYPLVGFRDDAGSFFLFLLVGFLQQQAAIAVGYVMGVLIHSIVVSAALTTLVMVVFMTGCGVVVAPKTIDDSRWMHSLEFSSPTRQSMLLIVREEMRHRVGGDLLVERVLGFDRAWDETWVLWLLLVVLVVSLRLVAAVLFRIATRPASYSGADLPAEARADASEADQELQPKADPSPANDDETVVPAVNNEPTNEQ